VAASFPFAEETTYIEMTRTYDCTYGVLALRNGDANMVLGVYHILVAFTHNTLLSASNYFSVTFLPLIEGSSPSALIPVVGLCIGVVG
jgi:hypothetical protein